MSAWDTPSPDAPLAPGERDALLASVATQIARRGLETPVLWALEIHRPFAFAASQGITALTPLIAPLVGLDKVQKAARLLAEPGIVDELIRRVEAAGDA